MVRAFTFSAGTAVGIALGLAFVQCARPPTYAEPERCIEEDCSDQRSGYGAGVNVNDASFDGNADYGRRALREAVEALDDAKEGP